MTGARQFFRKSKSPPLEYLFVHIIDTQEYL